MSTTATRRDAPAQELLVCIQTNTTLSDPKRLKSETDQLYLKSPQEMWDRFGELPEALIEHHSHRRDVPSRPLAQGIPASRVRRSGGLTPNHVPRAPVPQRRGRSATVTTREVEERLEYELRVIGDMRFTNYFLVVWDFVRFAKENGILVGPGRGSAAGSIVTYSLAITSLDPLKHGLIFERFLNPSRISMPDIDIDFADDRRDEVINYVVEQVWRRPRRADRHLWDPGRSGVVRDVGTRDGHALHRDRQGRQADPDRAQG